MSNFYTYNPATTHGPFLQRAISSSKDGDQYLADVRNLMVQMLDGDGSLDAHYGTIQAKFGFDSTATAHAAFAELDAAYQKTSGGANDLSGARAARDQLFSRFEV